MSRYSAGPSVTETPYYEENFEGITDSDFHKLFRDSKVNLPDSNLDSNYY